MPIKTHEKFEPLYKPMRYKVYHGGRNGMKTTEFSKALVIMAAQRKLRIMCGRQFMNTMEDSVKPAVEKQIFALGLDDEYEIQDYRILNRITGSKFRFTGLARNIWSIKGWEDYDIFWGEEANTITQDAFDLLTKTIRKPGSELWFSFNRHSRNDPIDKRFLSDGADQSNAVVVKVGWQNNPFLSEEQKAERIHDLKYNPDRYAHIWEGEPLDDVGGMKVLPYNQLIRCVGADKKLGYEPTGLKFSGLDVADEGVDTNCWSCRQGALLQTVREWKAKYLHITATRADSLNKSHGVASMHYDAGGLGAGIKSDLSRIPKNPSDGSGPGVKKFMPFLFGGKVYGPNRYFFRSKDLKIRNKDFFSKANAQAWWNVKLRVQNTIKALEGEKIDLDKCFFIDGDLDDLENVLAELSQCVYDDSTGKIVIDKAPDNAPSPNKADSIIMAYVHDIKRGLKAG